MEVYMTTSELVRKLCDEQNISLAELARRTGQSRQNLYQKLKRSKITREELKTIAEVLGVKFEQSFVLSNGEQYIIND